MCDSSLRQKRFTPQRHPPSNPQASLLSSCGWIPRQKEIRTAHSPRDCVATEAAEQILQPSANHAFHGFDRNGKDLVSGNFVRLIGERFLKPPPPRQPEVPC